MTWVTQYILAHHGDREGKKILDDIDNQLVQNICHEMLAYRSLSIALVAPFTGLRRFPQGRGFKQWTGDDSKALMKVCINYWMKLLQQLIIL